MPGRMNCRFSKTFSPAQETHQKRSNYPYFHNDLLLPLLSVIIFIIINYYILPEGSSSLRPFGPLELLTSSFVPFGRSDRVTHAKGEGTKKKHFGFARFDEE